MAESLDRLRSFFDAEPNLHMPSPGAKFVRLVASIILETVS
jgi:hypothetical protein